MKQIHNRKEIEEELARLREIKKNCNYKIKELKKMFYSDEEVLK